jgi:hypothetical protein
LGEVWLEDQIRLLANDEELAWHSSVRLQGEWRHLPMIDFTGEHPLERLHAATCTTLKPTGSTTHQLFRTGQSFHAYGGTLLIDSAWRQYLGRLLLLTRHGEPGIVDTRWVGHSLVRGFSALRWSHNTARYRAMPTVVRDQGGL